MFILEWPGGSIPGQEYPWGLVLILLAFPGDYNQVVGLQPDQKIRPS